MINVGGSADAFDCWLCAFIHKAQATRQDQFKYCSDTTHREAYLPSASALDSALNCKRIFDACSAFLHNFEPFVEQAGCTEWTVCSRAGAMACQTLYLESRPVVEGISPVPALSRT